MRDYPPEYDLPDGPSEDEMIRTLDAYGHLQWTVGNEDWIACADFNVFLRPDDDEPMVAYHVVVDCESGGFTDTLESGIIPASKLGKDWFPLWGYLDICAEHYIDATEPELQPDYEGAFKAAEDWCQRVAQYVAKAQAWLDDGEEIPESCMVE